ncbi:MAG: ATP-dependent 6-phosphofructokinase [Pirellulales bacterium]|nr:ATP-dependent 6-phosphofructokinase [Pirellulales bacterium]
MLTADELTITTLGPCRIDSPLLPLLQHRQISYNNVEETDRVLYDDCVHAIQARQCGVEHLPGFEPAGARKKIFFDPSKTRAGIVTCGGLCPGLNDVIRGIVMELYFHYGVKRIHGFCNGFQGFIPRYGRDVLDLTPDMVGHINEIGGTMLGSSRGEQDVQEIVDCLERMNINALFVIGGDGSLRGAQAIASAALERNLKIAVVGVPKTIDNDILFIEQSFGFLTAFSQAAESICAAHVEAKSAPNGIGLVKLMGRHSGFIACYASLARNDANFVLIPEIPFALEGERGLLSQLRERVERRGHAVIVVAEGAGQELIRQGEPQYDASGNVKLADIGTFLKEQIQADFKRNGAECNLKYIDPSYLIRSVPASPFDAVLCLRLAHNAVHAAMCGRTKLVVARWRGRFVHLPISLCVQGRNTVDPNGDLWMSVLESTGQPPVMR